MTEVTISLPAALLEQADRLREPLSATDMAVLIGGRFDREQVLALAAAKGLEVLSAAHLGGEGASPEPEPEPGPGGDRVVNRSELQQRYWIELGRRLAAAGSPLKAPEISKGYTWYNWSIGSSNHPLCANLGARSGRIAVWLNVQGPEAKALFDDQHRDRAEIEAELGFSLDWQRRPRFKESKILVSRPGDYTLTESWPELHAWTVQKLEALRRTFSPRVRGA